MNKKHINWETVGLGEKSDLALAKELGVGYNTIVRHRRLLGIKTFSSRKRALNNILYSKIKKSGLGTKPDSIIAEKFCTSSRTVCYIRNKLNIPAFRGLILTQEGFSCRSMYEAKYDAYLHENKIKHQHEIPVKNTPFICDFLVNNQYVEVAAMLGYKKYNKKVIKKKKIYKNNNIKIIWLTAKDVEELYKTCKTKIKFKITRKCSICKKQTHDLVKGFCRICYMKKWHKKPKTENKCCYCEKMFFAGKKKKYCCRQCYYNNLKFNWPSDEIIKRKLKTVSANKFSKELGVSISGLLKHMKQRDMQFICR